MRLQDVLRRCSETFEGQDGVDDVVAFLRKDLGCSRVESIQALAVFKGTSLGEAKRLVHESHAWDDVDDSGKLHDDLVAGVELLASGPGRTACDEDNDASGGTAAGTQPSEPRR